jgi:hypothetical protein
VPWNETPEHLVAEHRTMCAYLIWLQYNGVNCWAEKIEADRNGNNSPDFKVMHGTQTRPFEYTEVKNRNEFLKDINGFGGLFLSENKYNTMTMLHDKGFKSTLIVGLKDLIGFYDIGTCQIIDRYMGGRTDRSQSSDTEMMVVFDPDELCVFFDPSSLGQANG